MAIKTPEDKAKVRTAIKIYLSLKGSASAKQLASFINDCDLKVRANINPNVIAKEMNYLIKVPCSFLKVGQYKDNTNTMRYYLD